MKLILFLLISLPFIFNKVIAQEVLWAKSNTAIPAQDILVDKNGNVFTTGQFTGTVDFDPSSTGTFTLTSAGNTDMYILKSDSLGNFLWAKRMGGLYNEYFYDIAIDSSGNIYGTGTFQAQADFDPDPAVVYDLSATSGTYAVVFVLKLTNNGDFVWAKSIGNGWRNTVSNSVTVDVFGRVYITGDFSDNQDFNPGPGVFILDTYDHNDYDAFVLKLSNAGNFLWAGRFGASGGMVRETGQSILTDNAGNVFVNGTFSGPADFNPNPSVYANLQSINRDAFIVKLDSACQYVWAKKLGCPTSNVDYYIRPSMMVLDKDNNIYSTGNYNGTTDFDPSLSSSYLLSSQITTSPNAYLSKLDPNGNFLWAKSFGGSINETGVAVRFSSFNHVYLYGSSLSSTFDFDPSAGVNFISKPSGENVFISEFNSSGTYLGTKLFKGPTSTCYSAASAFFIDPKDIFYSAGNFKNTIDFDPNTTYTYSLTSAGTNYNSFYTKFTSSPGIVNTSPVTRCKPGSVVLNATASNGTIKWYASLTSTVVLATGNAFVTPTLSNTTTYYADATYYNSVSPRVPVTATILNQTFYSNQIIDRCSNTNFQFNNHTYGVTGTYNDTLISSGGCDSIITTQLTMIDTFKVSKTYSICPGSNISVGTNIYSVAGNYSDTLIAIGGCDSIVYTTLFVFPVSVTNKTITICAGDLYHVGQSIYNANGNYSDTLMTMNGCDSIINLNLVVIPAVYSGQSITIYSGQTINVGSYSHSATGVYSDTLVANNGCDSIVTTNLNVLAYQVSDEEWYVVHPKTNSSTLHSIKFTDNSNGIAVGEAGSILKTSNAGDTWENKNVSGKLSFMETFFVNLSIGYAVGHDLDFKDAIIKTVDGGNTWINQSIGYNAALTSVYFLNQDTGFVVGYFGTILKTLNGGLNWTVINSGTSNNLHSIVFTDALTGFIVGDGTLLKTMNGGVSWQLTTFSGSLRKITFLNSSTGFILSNNKILKTIDGGLNWNMILSSTNNLTSLHIVNANLFFATGYFGAIYKTIDGGLNWTTTLNSPTGLGLNSICFTDVSHGFVACTGGRIFRTTNSGIQWKDTINPNQLVYNSVCFADTNIAYATTETGEIRKITNGGATIQEQNSGLTTPLKSIYFTSRDTGIAVGFNTVLKTVDGGVNWQLKFTGPTINFFGLDFSNSMNGYAVGMDATIGALIYKTNDGGETWSSAVTPTVNPLFDVDFPTQSIGYAVGGMQFLGYPETSLILKTIDGGNSWSSLTINHTYAFNSVNFVNKDTGYVAGRYGFIFKTVNGGSTWQQLTPNFLGTIFGMNFINSSVGYVCGQDGHMAKTTDGGTTWNRVLSGTNNYIQSLAFDNTGMGYGVGYSSTLIKNGMSAAYNDFSICEGDSIFLNAERAGGLYPFTTNWNTSGNNNSIWVKPATTSIYTYTVTDGVAHSTVGHYTVNVTSPVTPVITDLGGVLMSNATSGNQWLFNGVQINGATSQSLSVTQNGSYSLIVSQNGCSSDTSLAVQVNVTGEHILVSNKELEVYPVPAVDHVYVKNSGFDKSARISMYDSRGIEVFYNEKVEALEKIDLSSFISGIYLVKVTDKNGVYYRKIVKE